MFTVYILKSESKDRLYIGFTRNLPQRLKFHNAGLNKSTKFGIPWQVVYTEQYFILQEATKRERFLKKQKNRNFYNRLVENYLCSSDA